MKQKSLLWLAIAGFVVYVAVLPLYVFPALERTLNDDANDTVASLENANLQWNGRDGYLSVPANMEKSTADAAAETIEGIGGVRAVQVMYDEERLLPEPQEETPEPSPDVQEAAEEEIAYTDGVFVLAWSPDEKTITGQLDSDGTNQIESIFGVGGLTVDPASVLPEGTYSTLGALGADVFDALSDGVLSVAGDTVALSGTAADTVDIEELQSRWSGIDGLVLEVQESEAKRDEKEAQTAIDEVLAFENIEFETGSADIKKDSQTAVEQIAEVLIAHETLEIDIVGHTDSMGDPEENLALSKNRAESVMNALIEKGIDPARLSFDGKGSTEPIADNETKEGRQENRRVEIIVKGAM